MINITNEDNMLLMARYPDNYFDLAIVDPPYGIGMGGSLNVNSKTNYKDKKWDDAIPTEEYFNELKRVSKNQIVWGANYFPKVWGSGCKGFIYWNKMNHHENRSDGELAYTSFNKLGRHFEYMWDGNRYGFRGGKIEGVGKKSIRIHPTEKPVALYEWLFKNYAEQNNRILDTHIGSGSIALAVDNMNKIEKMNLTLIGCELDKDYYNATIKRIEEQTSWQCLF